MKSLLISFLLFATVVCLKAQSNVSENTFYKHYTGSINQSISIIFNLYRTGDELEGSYYYLSEGKTLNLYGKMIGDSTFSIDEIDRSGRVMCSFSGRFEKYNTVMEGFWTDTTGILKRDFYAKEAYDSGTVHFDIRQIKMAEGTDSNVAAYEVIQPLAKEMKSAKAEDAINNYIESTLLNMEPEVFYQGSEKGTPVRLKKSRDFEQYGRDFISFAGKNFQNEPKVKGPALVDNIAYIDFNAYNILGLQFASVFNTGTDSISVSYLFHNLSSTTGKELKLDNLFKKGYQPAIKAELMEVLEKSYYPKGKSRTDIENVADGMVLFNNFYLTEKGIGFLRNEFRPLSEGIIDVFIPYSHVSKWIKPNGPLGWVIKP